MNASMNTAISDLCHVKKIIMCSISCGYWLIPKPDSEDAVDLGEIYSAFLQTTYLPILFIFLLKSSYTLS